MGELGELNSMEIESGVSAFTKQPFCQVRLMGQMRDGEPITLIGSLSPKEVRDTALAWLTAADGAESDAGVFHVLEEIGLDEQAIGAVISQLRSYRIELDKKNE